MRKKTSWGIYINIALTIMMLVVFLINNFNIKIVEDTYLIDFEIDLSEKGNYLRPFIPALLEIHNFFFIPLWITSLILVRLGWRENEETLQVIRKVNKKQIIQVGKYSAAMYVSNIAVIFGLLSLGLLIPLAYIITGTCVILQHTFFLKHLQCEVFYFYSLFPVCFTLYSFWIAFTSASSASFASCFAFSPRSLRS